MNQIHTVEAAEQHTAVVHARVPMDELTRFFDRAFAATAAALHDQGLAPAGPPFGLYRGMPGATVDVEAGFPVATRIEPSGDVEAGTLPAGRTVEAMHVGPYDAMVDTYAQVEHWMDDEGLRPGSLVWESYLTDPEQDPDPASWRTLIHWPVS